jgi:putative flippase GtrA
MLPVIAKLLRLAKAKADFMRFAIIGGCGFTVNFCMLGLLYHGLHLPIAAADLLAAEISLWATFAGNNSWTFRGTHRHGFWQKVGRYHAYNWCGLGINTALVYVLVRYAGWYYGVALVAGSGTALLFNYFFNKKVVFVLTETA